jgi:mRNA-degrading endonuclease RelE of RelBE toxin-antitoxin system
MRFRETRHFTREIGRLLNHDEYQELQEALILRPESGSVMPRTNGIRKLRWGQSGKGRGKRGGARIIYYWHPAKQIFFMLDVFTKNEQETLTREEEKALAQLVTEEFS